MVVYNATLERVYDLEARTPRSRYDSSWVSKGAFKFRSIINCPRTNIEEFVISIRNIKLPRDGVLHWEKGDTPIEGRKVILNRHKMSYDDTLLPQMVVYRNIINNIWIYLYLPHYVLQKEVEMTIAIPEERI